MKESKVIRIIYITFGFVFLLLGILGIFLPILPTTPFALLAAFCFSKGSEALHNWLLTIPGIGECIVDWNQHKVITMKTKIISSVLMVMMASFIIIKETIPNYAKVAAISIMIAVMIFIWTRKSVRNQS